MSGEMLMGIGVGLIVVSTVVFIVLQCVVQRKKRYLREKVYQIYD